MDGDIHREHPEQETAGKDAYAFRVYSSKSEPRDAINDREHDDDSGHIEA
jgi:hypothetical protein